MTLAKSIALLAALLTLFCAVSCEKKNDAKSETPAVAPPAAVADPAVTFESFANKVVSTTREYLEKNKKPDVYLHWGKDEPVSIDVKKTDSVMSPYVGVIVSRIIQVEQIKEERYKKVLGDTAYLDMNLKMSFASQK